MRALTPQNPLASSSRRGGKYSSAAETDITDVAVKADDTVSVTLWELTATTWEINLTDVTNGQSSTTPPEQYSGPGSSAEWVVEAAAQCGFRCQLSPLAPYSPGCRLQRPWHDRPRTVVGGDHDGPVNRRRHPFSADRRPFQRRLYGGATVWQRSRPVQRRDRGLGRDTAPEPALTSGWHRAHLRAGGLIMTVFRVTTSS